MAVAMDLGDPTSPFGSVHPRDKQDVGHRLALAGRAVAYKQEGVYYTGPIANQAIVTHFTPESVLINYTIPEGYSIEIRSHSGFEVSCMKDGQLTWMKSFVSKVDHTIVFIDNSCDTGNFPSYVRYAWREDPCVFKMCAVYCGDLPSPPFILQVLPTPY